MSEIAFYLKPHYALWKEPIIRLAGGAIMLRDVMPPEQGLAHPENLLKSRNPNDFLKIADRSRKQQQVRLPGFEPGLQAWEAYVITAGPQPLGHSSSSVSLK